MLASRQAKLYVAIDDGVTEGPDGKAPMEPSRNRQCPPKWLALGPTALTIAYCRYGPFTTISLGEERIGRALSGIPARTLPGRSTDSRPPLPASTKRAHGGSCAQPLYVASQSGLAGLYSEDVASRSSKMACLDVGGRWAARRRCSRAVLRGPPDGSALGGRQGILSGGTSLRRQPLIEKTGGQQGPARGCREQAWPWALLRWAGENPSGNGIDDDWQNPGPGLSLHRLRGISAPRRKSVFLIL